MTGWQPLARRVMFVLIFAFFVWAIGRAADAEAHYQPGTHNVRHAINLAWCGRSNAYCYAGAEAWRWRTAKPAARSTCGHERAVPRAVPDGLATPQLRYRPRP